MIEWLSKKFQFDKKYSEKDVNNIISQSHCFNDIPLLRRELISHKFLKRKNDGSKYWKTKTPPSKTDQSLSNKFSDPF